MKLIQGLTLGSVIAASATGTAVDSWNDKYEVLSSCLSAAARCIDAEGNFVAGWQTQASCTTSGYKWDPRYPTPAAMESAFNRAREQVLSEKRKGLYIVKLFPKVTVDQVESNTPASIHVGDPLRCGTENYLLLDGFPAEVERKNQLYSDPLVLPVELKISPHLIRYENENARKNGPRLIRRIQLSPSAKGESKKVLRSWMKKHEERRRLASFEDEASDLQLHIRYPHHEEIVGRRALEEDDDVLSAAEEIIASTSGNGTAMDWLIGEPEASWMEPYVHYSVENMDAVYVTQVGTSLTGTDFTAKDSLATLWQLGVHGEGEIVGVGDSGLDMNHCFFTDPATQVAARAPGQVYNYPTHRKVAQYNAYVDGDEGKLAGHGTHVCGSVAGKPIDGATSANGDPKSFKGMAYEAKIAFFDLGKPDAPSIFPPSDIGSGMFKIAYDIGARIHTNSWGGNLNAYTTDSKNLDQFAFQNQDLAVLFANGNSGKGPQGNVGTPATAKNAISVGASMNADRAWKFLNRDCPTLTDCSNNMASFSSNGPTSDNRIKPDIVAPGLFIGSSSSSTTCEMTFKAGTSMATPVTAGNAALVRQFIREGRFVNGQKNENAGFVPMGALIKAVLVNGANLLSGIYEAQTPTLDNTKPNSDQGHGRIMLTNTLFPAGNTADRSVLLDGNFAKMPVITQSGNVAEYKVSVSGKKSEIRATLVWFDPPSALQGTANLINDLDIKVVDPSGKTFYPNGLNAADTVNTVENIIIPVENVQPGDYLVSVSGKNIALGPQPFAIVVTGQFALASSGIPSGTVKDETGDTKPIQSGGSSDSESSSSTTTIAIAAGAVAVIGLVAFVVVRRRRSAAQGFGGNQKQMMQPYNPQGGNGGGYSSPMQGAMNSFRTVSSRFGGAMGGFGSNGMSSQGGSGLPAGWESAIDPNSGSTYFYNRSTGQTSWDPPR